MTLLSLNYHPVNRHQPSPDHHLCLSQDVYNSSDRWQHLRMLKKTHRNLCHEAAAAARELSPNHGRNRCSIA